MQGQHAPEIVVVTAGFCLIYLWHWRWGRNNHFFQENLDWRDTWCANCFIGSTCSPCSSMWDLPGCVSVDVYLNLLNAAPHWLAARPVSAHARCWQSGNPLRGDCILLCCAGVASEAFQSLRGRGKKHKIGPKHSPMERLGVDIWRGSSFPVWTGDVGERAWMVRARKQWGSASCRPGWISGTRAAMD